MDGSVGAIVKETISGGVTLTLVDPFTAPDAAVIFALPGSSAFARPELLIETVAGALEVQVTEALKSRELPSLKCPIAANCCESPAGIDWFAGVTAIEIRARAGGGIVALDALLPHPHTAIAAAIRDESARIIRCLFKMTPNYLRSESVRR